MKRFIFTQWMAHKWMLALIILGFFVADFILSVGITLSRQQMEYYEDNLLGNPEDQLMAFLDRRNGIDLWNELSFLKQAGEIQLLSQPSIPVQKDQASLEIQPVPVWFEKEEAWHIPVIKGRYLSAGDMKNRSRSIVLGKDAARKLDAGIGDDVTIMGCRYKVIGIAGRTYRETIWDYVMYLPLEAMWQKSNFSIPENDVLSILLKSGKEKALARYAGREDVRYEEVSEEIDASSIHNAITLTVIVSGCVFIVAVINITNLMLYWTMERRKAYGIMKAVGAHNGYIFKIIYREVLLLTVISNMLALIFQGAVYLLFPSSPLEISPANVLISMGIAFMTAGAAALVPSKRAMALQPVKILNIGDI